MDLAKNTIAIVDDDSDILLSAQLYLKKYFKKILCFSHPGDLILSLKNEKIDVILLDLNYQTGKNDGEEGIKFLKEIKNYPQTIEVLVMTAYSDVKIAVEAVKSGAFDFIVKPWQNEKLLISIMNAAQKKLMSEELNQKEIIINSNLETLSPLIGENPSMQKVRELISLLAPTDASILIQGETGTGKELVAKHIHQKSDYINQPFIQVDFASIPNELQSDVLFGNSNATMGRWDMAKGGSLFLRNISAMNEQLQRKLFNSFPLNKESPARIISSINSDINFNHFRQDLFFKLNTVEINLPSLSERKEDLYELIDYFIEHFNTKYRKSIRFIEKLNNQSVISYPWKGNVKELKRAIERVVIVNQEELSLNDLIPNNSLENEDSLQTLNEIERNHIEIVLKKNNLNIQKSAAELGISRAALYRRIEKYMLVK